MMDDLFRSNPNEEIRPENSIPAEMSEMPEFSERPEIKYEAGEPYEPAGPELTFESGEPYEPAGPELTFESGEPYEPAGPELTFGSGESYEPAGPDTDSHHACTEPLYEPGNVESTDVRCDEPYEDGADYDDEYYDEYYDEYDDSYQDGSYPEDPYADDGYGSGADYENSTNVRHSYDPNGTEDEKPVYGSYYNRSAPAPGSDQEYGYGGAEKGEATGPDTGNAETTDSAAGTGAYGGPELPPDDGRGPYKSKYDAYRYVAPDSRFTETPVKTGAGVRERTEKKEGKKRGLLGRILTTALLAAVFGIIASGFFLGVLKLTGYTAPHVTQENEIAEASPSPLPSLSDQESRVTAGKADTSDDIAAQKAELTVPEVVEMCMPSMVAITNTSVQQYYDFFGGTQSRENVSAGSGIIVSETDTELLIATNNHVITNSSEIAVTFINDTVMAGTVKGTDADNDLAIVAVKLDDIDEETKGAIRMISIGDSDSLAVGETVVAIGNALGYGQSVSRGVISALNREVTVDGMAHQLIQTDATINPGNSGGALLNMRGELIGINEIKYVDKTVEGVGYAIPMATAKPILESLGGKSARTIVDDDQASYIGISCVDVPSYYVQSGYPSGVYVSELTKGGPADKAGVKEGDIITAMDGISISSTSQLITYLRYYAAGEEIDFSVSRLNEDETAFEKVKIKITLGRRKDSNIDDSKESKSETVPDKGAENGGFDVIPDQKR